MLVPFEIIYRKRGSSRLGVLTQNSIVKGVVAVKLKGEESAGCT